MLIKTYSLNPHCVSCWTIYILQNDTRTLQCKVNFNIIFPPGLTFAMWPLFLYIFQLLYFISPIYHSFYMPCSTHTSSFDYSSNICWCADIMTLLFEPPVVSYLQDLIFSGPPKTWHRTNWYVGTNASEELDCLNVQVRGVLPPCIFGRKICTFPQSHATWPASP